MTDKKTVKNNSGTINLNEVANSYSDPDPIGAGNEALSFEEALAALENIVKRLESSDTTLDESMELFKEGTELTKLCDLKLNQAQLKIKQLIGESEEDFTA